MTHALHLTTWHPTIDGVSGVFVLEQCAALRDVGLDIGLIFSRIQGFGSLKLTNIRRGFPSFVQLADPVPTLGFKSWSLPGAHPIVPTANIYMLRNRYAAYVRKFGRPDVLHAHVAMAAGKAAHTIARSTGIGYVVTEHSSEILNRAFTTGQCESIVDVYRDARCVLSVSNGLADRIREICPAANIRVIGNVVRGHVFSLRRENHAPRQTFEVMSIGSLSTNKRMQDAISALAALPSPLRDRVHHRIAGDGPEMASLMRLAERTGVRTTFYGNMPHGEAMNLLAQADALLHASSYETFGVVAAEALALGKPVICTQCGGPEEFIDDTVGILVPVGDVRAMSRAIEKIYDDRRVWQKKAPQIAQFARERFHEDSVTAKTAEVYK